MIFVDTDILLDVAWNREPFSYAAADVLTLAAQGKVEIGTTTIVLTNVYYLLSSRNSVETATEFLLKLLKIVKFVPVKQEDVVTGLESGFKDKEDAINHFAAISASCPMIITRNKRDFVKSQIPVMTAEEYIVAEWPDAE